MTPSCEKLDLHRLRKDIPKYYPFLQSHSLPEWNRFLEQQLDDLTSVSQPSQHLPEFRKLIIAGNSTTNVLADEVQDVPANEEVSVYCMVARYNFTIDKNYY